MLRWRRTAECSVLAALAQGDDAVGQILSQFRQQHDVVARKGSWLSRVDPEASDRLGLILQRQVDAGANLTRGTERLRGRQLGGKVLVNPGLPVPNGGGRTAARPAGVPRRLEPLHLAWRRPEHSGDLHRAARSRQRDRRNAILADAHDGQTRLLEQLGLRMGPDQRVVARRQHPQQAVRSMQRGVRPRELGDVHEHADHGRLAVSTERAQPEPARFEQRRPD